MPRIFSGLLFFALSLACSAFGQTMMLKDGLREASEGDYIVTAQERNYTVLLVTRKDEQTLTIEEISVPETRFPRGTPSWRQWVEQGAHGHTAWVSYEIDAGSGKVLQQYSFTRNGWCDIHQAENFLSTLLSLRLHPVEDRHRKRVGPLPVQAHRDNRPFWSPRMVVEGQIQRGVPMRPWKTRWPNDGSELAGKIIEVYLPERDGPYPRYFPYWLQVSGVVGKANMRIIDAGQGLRSPKASIPTRPLSFLNNGDLQDGSLILWVVAREHQTSLDLRAVQVSSKAEGIPLRYSLQRGDQPHTLMLRVPADELQSKLKQGERYVFVVHSRNHPADAAQTAHPLQVR